MYMDGFDLYGFHVGKYTIFPWILWVLLPFANAMTWEKLASLGCFFFRIEKTWNWKFTQPNGANPKQFFFGNDIHPEPKNEALEGGFPCSKWAVSGSMSIFRGENPIF